jgi:NTE family protein
MMAAFRGPVVLDTLLGRGKIGDAPADTVDPPQAAQPRIGLAFGGGAARGFAHIGVMQVLLERGIVPDVIVGTSIGAVVGGCYAGGKLDDLTQWALSLTTRRVLGYLDISIAGSGLIGGDRLARRLEQALGGSMIEELPCTFAAIATEIGTSHEIWLTRGRMVEALRASYALPGIFSPVRLGGRWLVDGTLVNPVPVSTARALGARMVIAVNLSADRFGRGTTIASHGSDDDDLQMIAALAKSRNGLARVFNPERRLKRKLIGEHGRPGLSTVMVEAFNVMQDRITRARLAGDPPDVLISPRVGAVGWFDFHRADTLIAAGREAAERAIEPIAEAIAALA